MNWKRSQIGLTMIELLVVVAILATLVLLVALSLPRFMVQSWDATRKDDLQKLKNAFEHYYQDTGCYPDPSLIAECGGDGLKPYMQAILCDPVTKQPYQYYRSGCHKYRIFTKLEYTPDPSIERVGCSRGCGGDLNGDGLGDGNFGVSSSNATLAGRVPICGNDEPMCSVAGDPGCCPGSDYKCEVDLGWCEYQPK